MDEHDDFRRRVEDALSSGDATERIPFMLTVGKTICRLIDFESRSAFYIFPSGPGARLAVQSRSIEGDQMSAHTMFDVSVADDGASIVVSRGTHAVNVFYVSEVEKKLIELMRDMDDAGEFLNHVKTFALLGWGIGGDVSNDGPEV